MNTQTATAPSIPIGVLLPEPPVKKTKKAAPQATCTPTMLGKGIEADPAKFGGKGASLIRILDAGIPVPYSWCVPCDQFALRPKLDLYSIRDYVNIHTKFAVRSSGPVSMPGMMTTKLNVEFADIQAAVEAVWDSFNSPHAKKYRKDKGIPDESGVAVVIQVMVNAYIAGVIFTNDPNNLDDVSEFKPIIEYVEGLGDQLVGGEVTPKKMPASHSSFGLLSKYAATLHNTYGACDLEFCVIKDSYGGSSKYAYIVQQRALKFAKKQLKSNPADYEGKTLLLEGNPIGAPKTVTCKVVLAADYIHKPLPAGVGIYVDAFKPEYYEHMVDAAAILTISGGATCHASIVARELDKPAISGVIAAHFPEEDYLKKGPMLTLDGATGNIFLADVPKKKKGEKIESMPEPEKAEVVLDPARIPQFEYIGNGFRNRGHEGSKLLVRFYNAIDQCSKNEITVEQRDAIVKEIADLFCVYFYLAVIGETRHLPNYVGESSKRIAMYAAMESFGMPMSKICGKGRTAAWASLTQPKSIQEAVGLVTQCHIGFTGFSWSSNGYGGKKWGNISNNLLRYLTGKLTPLLFVDSCFNLKHNGGNAFSKATWLTYDSYLQGLLDLKAKKPFAEVIKSAEGTYGEKTIKGIIKQKTIFKLKEKVDGANVISPKKAKKVSGGTKSAGTVKGGTTGGKEETRKSQNV